MNMNNNKLKSLLILVGVIAVIALAVYGYNQTNKNNDNGGPVAVNNEETVVYENEVYGLRLEYPQSWNIQSTGMDDVKNPLEGFNKGTAFVEFFGAPESDGGQKKIEVFLVPTTKTAEDIRKEYEGLAPTTYNDIEWFIERKNSGSKSESLQAIGLVVTEYAGVPQKNTIIVVTGFDFADEETSVYSPEVESALRSIVADLTLIPR